MAAVPPDRIVGIGTRAKRATIRFLNRQRAGWKAMLSGTSESSESSLLSGLQSAHPRQRWESAAEMGRDSHLNEEAVAALVSLLADPEEFVAWQAASALGQQDSGRVFGALAAALSDRDPRCRAGAARALGFLGGEAAAGQLAQRLGDPVSSVRVATAEALGRTGDPGCAESLVLLLSDESTDVRRAAAQALGKLGSPQTAPPLAQALQTPSQPLLVRRALAAALAAIPHPDARPVLMDALSDADPQVRAYAAQALGHVGDESAYAALLPLLADRSRLLQGTVSSEAEKARSMLERRGRRGLIAGLQRETRR